MKKLTLIAAMALISTNAAAYDQSNLVLGLGVHNAFDSDDELGGNIEWRGRRFDESFVGVPNISPQIGLSADVEGDVNLYAGVLYDFNMSNGISIVPSFSVGLYNHADDGIDLGGALNFRSSIEVNYMYTADTRLGLNLAHISNFGIYDDNPGTETLTFNYSFAY